MNPFQIWTDMARASYQVSAMTMEAQTVIWMRLWGMVGAWNVAPRESSLMVSEKVVASLKAQQATVRAMMAGKSPLLVASAAIKPVRRKTSSNLARLSKRGPKIR